MLSEKSWFGRQVPQPSEHGAGRPALVALGQGWQCQRCHQWTHSNDRLPNGNGYCRQCLQMGRLTTQDKLYTIPEPNRFSQQSTPILSWLGSLSPQQQQASRAVLQYLRAHRNHLLWAVTGAGKTEIAFPALAWALAQGWRVAWCSPRVDVCLELAPRLQRAFATTSQAILYGGQTRPYTYSQLTICTTHQLLRFQSAFDWIIVDEVDAFPLRSSPMLQSAVRSAQKPTGSQLLLTATPGPDLQRLVRRHELAVTYVPLRYHGVLLPQIDVQIVWHWRQRLENGRLPAKLTQQVRRYLADHQPFLLFVPHVVDLQAVQAALDRAGILDAVTVHAADPRRQEKVLAMREHRIPFLVTTTILERGVTFANVAVIIFGGDDEVFSTAALVQIAGRVGRSAQYPTGEVTCYCHSQTRVIQGAQHMIGQLNRQGRLLGGRIS
ncbi:superfamily II DNA RNA helicase [Levilactobacillus senmaizukei DSM 21775 = NBRC 103853]|uniref:Superfamily II DNA RNA helicase n=1 Tax=Levilactobacillus senmaizukei DSM 21775 = NBRC 103853 TaxID=1423803 RepID=A0A0R2DNY5_9LACO|nr:DNA/RNA helicase [Levilactobacillus senmaizukei]KRN02455.1 superfamily II DNA RNA helicase [Levilactobacillus senmaizukei DSM 21775 = NBRC 103853]